MKKTILSLLFVTILSSFSFGSVKFELNAQPKEISAGSEFTVECIFTISANSHIYSNTEKDIGLPTTIDLELPQGFKIKKIDWSPTQKFSFMGIEGVGYENKAIVKYIIQTNKNQPSPSNYKIRATSKWLECSSTCVPGESTSETEIKVTPQTPQTLKTTQITQTPPLPQTQNLPKDNSLDTLAILLGAFLGGMILNLMPCVFPVIGLKILSFVDTADKSRTQTILASIFYTLGIVVSFLILASILLGLRALGQNLGWGFQLQNPIFTGLMAILFFGMALSFAGVFEIGTSFAGGMTSNFDNNPTSEKKSEIKKYLSSAGSGVVAVLVASPCTAPFMGTAVGAALSAEASTTLFFSVFLFLGLGMAIPYVILSAIPSLTRHMPKPGKWMDIFKRILSVPLFATVLWLGWVYNNQTPQGLIFIIGALIILTVGAIIYGKIALPYMPAPQRMLGIIVFLISIICSITAISLGSSGTGAELPDSKRLPIENTWTPQKVIELQSKGIPVYVDFTASWCLTCQYNKTVLHSKEIEELFKTHNVKILIGDWTNKDESITQELAKFGRAGVPLNLYYPPKANSKPIELPAILTTSSLKSLFINKN